MRDSILTIKHLMKTFAVAIRRSATTVQIPALQSNTPPQDSGLVHAMPAKPYSSGELRRIVTSSPVTSNFRHLLPVNKRLLRKDFEGRQVKAVPAKERIKWWNIVPGDQVRVVAEKATPVRSVLGINKISNRVFVQSDKKVRSQC